MTAREIIKALMPPAVWNTVGAAWRKASGADSQTFAPDGEATRLEPANWSAAAWTKHNLRDRLEIEGLRARLAAGEALQAPDAKGQLNYMNYAYVLARVARGKRRLKVLDYGGALGDYYWAARYLLPDVELEYHCKELPQLIADGKAISPEICWHDDDSCFDSQYDLVIFVSSLQYIPEWPALIRRAAAAPTVFVSLTPVVLRQPGYVWVQRDRQRVSLSRAINRAELLSVAAGAGLTPVHEFLYHEHEPVKNAPENPQYRGFLFERR